MARYVVGDKIVLHELFELENTCDYVLQMGQYAGMTLMITELSNDDSGYYRLYGRGVAGVEHWWWTDEMINHDSTDARFGRTNSHHSEDDMSGRIERYSCANCGNLYEDLYPRPISSQTLCPNCRKRLFLLPYHRFQPPLEFYGKSAAKTQLFMGVEIEVSHGSGNQNRDVKTIMPIINEGVGDGKFFAYCASDSSLDCGIELITQPATLRAHKARLEQYQKTFAKFIELGYRSHNSNCCGIHVHINRDFFEGEDEKCGIRIARIFERFWNDIVVFSRRDKHKGLTQYTKKADRPAKAFVERWNKSDNHDSHYYALNFANRNTIEFRIFRGTLNLNTFVAILEFVDAICRFAKAKTTAQINEMAFDDILTTHASAYFAHRNKQMKFEEV